MSIQSDLDAFGMAQVLVVLKPAAASLTASNAGNLFSSVVGNFCHTEQTRDGALAASVRAMAAHVKAGVKKAAHAVKERLAKAPEYHVYPNLGVMLGTIDPKGYAGLQANAKVSGVMSVPEFSLIRPVARRVSTKLSVGPTWGLKRMRVPKVWEAGFTGKDVIVGHLDTGVDGKHPALKKAVHVFAEFDDFGQLIPDAPARDSDDHGTHTAGTIAGRKVPEGEFGVAPGCLLASAMVIEGGNIVARILGGMDWVIGQNAKILSMSLGLRGFNTSFLSLMQIVRDRGILPVIAIGNEGPGTSRSPGNYPISLSVGASDKNDFVADFSSSQKINRPDDPIVPDIVAPGVATFSALPNKEFGEMDGSSMATPHVAGLAALLWEAKPDATVDEIESAIFGACERPDTMPESRANRGLPDAVRALEILTGQALPAPKPTSPVGSTTAKKKATKKTAVAVKVKKGVAKTASSRKGKR